MNASDFRPQRGTPDSRIEAPASSQQRSLWFLHQLDPSDSSYNENKVLRLCEPINSTKLGEAIRALVARHHVLRTVYVSRQGALLQRVLPAPEKVLNCRDAAGDLEDKILQDIATVVSTPLDLQNDLPIRATLYQMAEEKHILHLCIHHIATDGWSWPLVLKEIFAIYGDAPVRPPGMQYAEYSRVQQDVESEAFLAPALAYWTGKLAGAEALKLPRDCQTTGDERRGGSIHFSLSSEIFARVKSFARARKTTPFVILLSTYKLMLARLSGQGDITVGVPVSNRLEEKLERMVGMFVNTIAVRSQLREDQTFSDFVNSVRLDWLQSLEYQHAPFDRLVAALQPDRDPGRNPVFQAFFSFLRAPHLNIDVPGVDVELVRTECEAARFDLELSLQENSDGIVDGQLIYDRDLFRFATASTMVSLYLALLDTVTQDPDAGLWTIALMSKSDTQKVLRDWNATNADQPDCAIPELFEQQASETPDAVAIRDGSSAITYRELRERANSVAARLLDMDVGAGLPVAVHMRRSTGYVVACLGVLKSGGVLVPIDTTLPEARRHFILKDCGATVLLCGPQTPLLDLPEGVRLETVAGEFTATRNELPKVSPDDPAYVLYTSGSTGDPNGVVGAHCALVNRLFWIQSAYPLTSDDVCAAKTRIGFVDSLTETLAPLLFGATLSIVGDDEASDPRRLVVRLAETGTTRVVLVPSVLRAMLDATPDIAARLPVLRFWTVSGETLTRDLVDKFHAACPGRILLNLYGSTEVCGDATFSEARVGDTPNIGHPIANTRCYILDRRGEPVPVGLPAQLWIGGAGLAHKYLNREELTRERFVVTSVGGLARERLFRTGDRARYLPDGGIEFLGRSDGQVKLRGVRIEVGEIETALRAMDRVLDAVVLSSLGADSLVASVRGSSPTCDAQWAQSLRAGLARTLPQAFVPAQIHLVEDFPRTASGKIDRRACLGLQPRMIPAKADADIELPLDSQVLEDRMLDLWRDVLNDPSIEKDADFFELGGHSLLAVSLVGEIEKTFGVRLPLALLFKASTARQLAARLLERPGRFSAFLLEQTAPDLSTPPLFCLRGLFYYRGLAAALKEVAPVYAVLLDGEEKFGDEDETVPVKEMDEIIDHYVANIRRVSPEGPYYLAGLSAGGLVAIEVARRLKASGDRVALLALLDTNAPGVTLRKHVIEGARSVAKAVLGRKRRKMPIARDIDLLYRAGLNQLAAKPYNGDVVLFRAMESSFGWRPRDLGWGRFIDGRVTLLDVPGNHLSMMRDPHVESLAQTMSEWLSPSSRHR